MTHPYHPVHSPNLQPELHRPWYSCQEYSPSRHLESHVASYWTMYFQPVPDKQIHWIIPDGCIDIVINLYSPSSRKAAHVTGLTTRSEVLHFSEARSLFGIRIYSEAARTILKFPLSMFQGQRVFLEDVWGFEGLYWVEQILTAETTPDILAIADRQLSKVLAESNAVTLPLVSQSMQIIYHNKGNLSVTDLAEQAHCSERHLRRSFKQELGLSPKEMLGIIRFQSTLKEFYKKNYSSLTDLALLSGYYDQSHFTNSFPRYFGLPVRHLTRS